MAKKILNTLPDVESAMNELQSVLAELGAAESEANTKISEIRQTFVESTGKLQEKAKKLSNSIETFAEENKDDTEFFPAGRKSLNLNAGTISIKLAAPAVANAEGVKSEDVIKRIEINQLTDKLVKLGDPVLDKSAVKRLYDEGEIDDKLLKRLGLKIAQKESITIMLSTVDTYA